MVALIDNTGGSLFALVLIASLLPVAYTKQAYEPDQHCPQNEVYRSGGCCEPSCDKPKIDVCVHMLTHGCFCQPGYLRERYRTTCQGSQGKCIPKASCPKRGLDE